MSFHLCRRIPKNARSRQRSGSLTWRLLAGSKPLRRPTRCHCGAKILCSDCMQRLYATPHMQRLYALFVYAATCDTCNETTRSIMRTVSMAGTHPFSLGPCSICSLYTRRPTPPHSADASARSEPGEKPRPSGPQRTERKPAISCAKRSAAMRLLGEPAGDAYRTDVNDSTTTT